MKYSFLYYSDVFYKINFAILYLYNLISGGYLFFMRFLRTKYGYPYFLRRRKAIHGTRYCYSTMCSALVLGAGVSGFICFKQGISYRKKQPKLL